MPTRLYQPPTNGERYSALDRLTAHEWASTIVGGAWAAIGAVLCWSWVRGGGPATVLSQLSEWQAGAIAVVLLVCGLAVLTAIVWPGEDATAWRIELIALPIGVGAWVAYAVASPSIFWQIIAAGYVLGAVLRFRTAWLSFHQPQRVVILEG